MKTEFLDMLLTRRSVRAYKPDPVPTALLEEVLRAGTLRAHGRRAAVPGARRPSRTRRRATRSPA